jgi:CheY-like chemotaxis protein
VELQNQSEFEAVMMLECDRYTELAAECRELGISYIMKPFSEPELVQAIRRAILPGRGVATVPTSGSGRLDLRLNILVAEDNSINQKLTVKMLQSMGHTVTLAQNGTEAVEKAKQRCFDLILMDVQMPEMDGLAATEAIRAWERSRGRRTPIIAITASAMKGDREQCLHADMDGYVSKPFSRAALQTALLEFALADHLVTEST